MDEHTEYLALGSVYYTVGLALLFGVLALVSMSNSDLLLSALAVFLLVIGYGSGMGGVLYIFYSEKINTVFIQLRDCLKYKYYDEMAEKLKLPERLRRGLAGLCIMQLHSDFFSSPFSDGILSPPKGNRLKGENKLIYEDIHKLASLSQSWLEKEPRDVSVNDFHEAFLHAVNHKIKHPLRKYRGANYFLKNKN